MADKSSQLILEALGRAAAAGAGAPLHGSKTTPGLFPATAAGKQAAQRCQDEGYLRPAGDADAPDAAGGTATLVKKKTSGPALYAITDKGLSYLLGQVSPRQVLEDFVRAVEARRQQADELLTIARGMQDVLDALKANADRVLRHACGYETSPESGGLKALYAGFRADTNGCGGEPASSVDDLLLAELTRWHDAGSSEDCPLPHLYRQTAAGTTGRSIGQFHDALRRLHDRGRIYLHPWTGPLYDIPEPPYALLIGHEIAYYASIRCA